MGDAAAKKLDGLINQRSNFDGCRLVRSRKVGLLSEHDLWCHNSSWNISPELLLGLGPPIIDLRGETDISSRYRVDGRQGFESVTAKTSKQKGGTNKTIKVAHKKISTWPSGGRKKQRHMVLGSIYVMSSLNFQGG